MGKASVPVETLRIRFRKVDDIYMWEIGIKGEEDLVSFPVRPCEPIDFDGGESIEISLDFEKGSKWIIGTYHTYCYIEAPAVPDELPQD